MYMELNHICFAYENKEILKDISFGLERGEIVGLIGANGAGKTTTIRTMMKKLKPQAGTITIKGKNINDYLRTSFPVSYIPDEPVYYEELTMMEHFDFVKALYPKCNVDVDSLIKRFELEEHLYKVPGLLSKGTLQKMMIVVALIREFDVLLADEPMTGLDPKQISVLKDTFSELKEQKKAVLISTHLLDLAENFCDKYIFINKGIVVAYGSKEDIAAKAKIESLASLEQIYLAMIN